jgi:hypothetical protein
MAAAAVPVTMEAYLEVTLGIGNINVRTKIIHEGYRSLDVLVKNDKAWVKSLRLSIKKSTGNAAASSAINASLQSIYLKSLLVSLVSSTSC